MYRDDEKNRIVSLREELFNDLGYGEYFGKKREFVLEKPELNIWDKVRDDAIKYFSDNKIQWHKGKGSLPTGHLLSSQVACINHLYFLRNKKNLVSLILKDIDPNIVSAEEMDSDSSYVEFEFIGKTGLPEKSHKRGANCTSVDACMVGKNKDGEKILFFIEWKYTELYGYKSKQCKAREEVYNDLIRNNESPFKDKGVDIYYYEPFYQLMRQTLLAEQCIKDREYGCSDYRLIHVIPKENGKLINTITSKDMTGSNISEAWKNVLKRENTYISITPRKLISSIVKENEASPLIDYLNKRYGIFSQSL